MKEICQKPLEYYSNNIINKLSVLNLMKKCDIKNFVFSSLATVHGNPYT